jgi:hypothetical protein
VKYSVNYQNGGFATFEWEGDLEDEETSEEQLDNLLEAAYEAAPTSLCHQCARNFDISDDTEVIEIREDESRKLIYKEPSRDDRLRADVSRTHKENNELRLQLIEAEKQRNALAAVLRDAGFNVDVDTFAVSR